jgi:hypothetical protein
VVHLVAGYFEQYTLKMHYRTQLDIVGVKSFVKNKVAAMRNDGIRVPVLREGKVEYLETTSSATTGPTVVQELAQGFAETQSGYLPKK